MSKGKGKGPQLSRGQRFEILEKKVKQMEMAMQVSQMLVQQMGNGLRPMQDDLAQTIGRQRELQYRVLAMQEVLDVNADEISKRSEDLQVKDFEETSAKEDQELGYTETDVVAEDSAVIITSTTPSEEEDKGVLRSKLVLAEIALPELKEGLIGKKVGEKVEVDIRGIKHNIELLGIRTVPAPQVEEPEAPCKEGCGCADNEECTECPSEEAANDEPEATE